MFARIKFDEERGYAVRRNDLQASIPADALEWWAVSARLVCRSFYCRLLLSHVISQLHAHEYHHGLPEMARDYLGIPAATVDLERRFSIAGNMVTKRRHRLKADTIRACQLLRSWKEAGVWDLMPFWEKQNVLK